MNAIVPIIVATNAANAANAAVREQRAREHCKAIMPAYQDAGATVEQRHEYASCVDRMYPQHDGGFAVFLGVIVALLIGLSVLLFLEASR